MIFLQTLKITLRTRFFSRFNLRSFSTAYQITNCSGCGVSFHENHPNQAGYLPDMENRKRAFQANLDYSFYKQHVLGIKSDVLVKYEMKKTLERLHVPSTPPMDDQSAQQLLCSRCHSITYHGISDIENDTENQKSAASNFDQMKQELMSFTAGGVVIVLGDVLDFPTSLDLNLLRQLTLKVPTILVINKIDLLSKGTNLDRLEYDIRKYLRDSASIRSLSQIQLVSSRDGVNIDQVMKSALLIKKPLDNIYVIGMTNVGKSSFINAILHRYDGPKIRKPTTSLLPGTTIDSLSIPLKDLKSLEKIISVNRGKLNANLVDTPGLSNSHQLLSFLSGEELKFLSFHNPLKPRVFSLLPGRSIWIGGLCRVDFIEGKAQLIVAVCCSPKVPIHTSNTIKSDWLWNKHGGGRSKNWADSLHIDKDVLLHKGITVQRKNENKSLWSGVKFVPPFFSSPEKYLTRLVESSFHGDADGIDHERVKQFPKLTFAMDHTFSRAKPLAKQAFSSLHFEQALSDLVINGIGYVSFAGNFDENSNRSAKIKVFTPKGEGVFMRTPSLFPFEVMKRGKKVGGCKQGQFQLAKDSDITKATSKENDYWQKTRAKMTNKFESG